MKKTLMLVMNTFILLSFASCNKTISYTVTWENYDNSVLEVDNVKKGDMPEYNGQTPTRKTDETYVYEFIGWSEEIVEATKDITYTATFKATPYYHVSFVNYDNTSLQESIVLQGELPTYQGNTPEKEEDDAFSYEFNGWTPEVTIVNENTTYTATYTSTLLPIYHVTFLNYDDSFLYETDVIKKHEAVFDGETPTKPEDDEFKYEFNGWDQDLSHIYSDVTTKATFKQIAKEDWGPLTWF